MRKMLTKKTGITAVAVIALLGLGTGGAVAADLIGSKDIRDNSVKSKDIRDGTIKSKDIKDGRVRYVDLDRHVKGKFAALEDQIAELEARVADLENSRLTADWGADNPDAAVDGDSVTLTVETGGETSFETDDLNVPVQSGDVISFRYSLADGAECTAGAPRMFVEIDGAFANSWDQNIGAGTQCGEDATDEGGTVTFTAPSNGRIGQAGLVYDNGVAGTVTFSDVTVDGNAVSFQ